MLAHNDPSHSNIFREESFDLFEALHYRYLCLGAHYRSQLFFSFEALQAAKNAFESLKNRVISWKLDPQKGAHPEKAASYLEQFNQALSNDLDMPVALSVLWEMVKDLSLGSKAQLNLITQFDQVLGLGVDKFEKVLLSEDLMALVQEREEARANKNWVLADELRKSLLEQGICLKDSPVGTDWYLKY